MKTIRIIPLKKLFAVSAILTTLFFVTCFALVSSGEPTFVVTESEPLTAQQLSDLGVGKYYASGEVKFTMRDGKSLHGEHFPSDSNLTFIVVHGVLGSSETNNRFSGLLREHTSAEVYSMDFRGHGKSVGKPGELDYIDQYIDDLEDIVSYIKGSHPNKQVILVGHSMGGGISLRYAIHKTDQMIDGFIMFAPLLGQDSPTLKMASDDSDAQPFMKAHLPRIIGLALLNTVGLSHWNDQPVLFFNLPPAIPLRQYSFSASASMSPENFQQGLEAINKPLLVIVGAADETFNVPAFAQVIPSTRNKQLLIAKESSHNGVRHNLDAMDKVSDWTREHFLPMSKPRIVK